MKSKLYLALVAALWLALILFSPAQAGKSYQAERFDVTIAVQPDGTLNITETIVFRFTGGSFTYVYRELALKNLDQIDNIQASLDGMVLAQGAQPVQVEITTGQPIKATWHFAPAQDAAHEFTLAYRVKGAIRQDAAADTLFWRAIPAEHEYTISHGLIRIEYPAGVMPISSPSLSGTGASFATGSTGATFTLNTIDADTPVDITASFPRQRLIVQRRHGGWVQMALSVLLLLIGGGFFPPLIGLIGGAAGTQINRPLGTQPGTLTRLAAKLWPYQLVVLITWLLAQFPIGYFFNDFLKSIMGGVLLFIVTFLPLSVYTGYARDAVR